MLNKYVVRAVLFYWYPTRQHSSISGGNLGQFPSKALCLFIRGLGGGVEEVWVTVGNTFPVLSLLLKLQFTGALGRLLTEAPE